jgi:hypothetical protein
MPRWSTRTPTIQKIEEYRYRDNDPRRYEEDHLISLELG